MFLIIYSSFRSLLNYKRHGTKIKFLQTYGINIATCSITTLLEGHSFTISESLIYFYPITTKNILIVVSDVVKKLYYCMVLVITVTKIES